jgi:membrane-associated phospholipid phosphatase
MRRFRPGAGVSRVAASLLVLLVVVPFDAALHDLAFRVVNTHGVRLVANGVTHLGTSWASAGLLGALALVGRGAGDAGLVRASLGGIAGVALGSVAGQAAKQVVCRGRPKLLDGWGLAPLAGEGPGPAERAAALRFFHWPCPRDSLYHSFPSGHAVAAFAVAAALVTAAPRRRAVWLGAAAAVGASRVLLNAHFVSDVVSGALIGWWATRLVEHLADRLVPRGEGPVPASAAADEAPPARVPTL